MVVRTFFIRIKGFSWIVKTNIRSSTLSIIGLILALILSTVVIVGTRSAENLLLKESFKDNDISIIATPQFDLTQEINYDIISSWNTSFVNQLFEYNLGNYLDMQDQSFLDWEYTFPGENASRFYLNALQFPILENLYNITFPESKLPQNFNETIIITEKGGKYNSSLGKMFQFSSNTSAIISGFPVSFWVNNTFTVSGIVFYEDLPFYLKDKFFFSTSSSPTNKIVLLTNPEMFMNFVNHSITKLDSPVRSAIAHLAIVSPSLKIEFQYSFNFSLLNKRQTGLVNTGIDLVSNVLSDYSRNQTIFLNIGFNHNLSNFKYVISVVDRTATLYLVLALPMLIVALLLINFSFGIINHKRAQTIEVLKTRGLNNRLIFILLTIETFVLYFIAFIVALIIGIPLTTLMSQSNQLLDFSRPTRSISILETDLFIIFILNLVFITIIYLKPIITISKSKIVELEHWETEKPFWQKQYLDLLLLIIGISVSLLGKPFLAVYLENPLVYQPILPMILVLFLLSPLFLLLGMILLFSRGTEFALRKLSEVLWEKRGGFFSLALKNLHLNNQLTSRAGLVIGLATCLLVVFSTISVSLSASELNRIVYETGSDMSITISSKGDVMRLVENMSYIEGVDKISVAVSYFYQNSIPSASDSIEIKFVGIQPNSVELFPLKDYYSGNNLSAQIGKLANSTVLVNIQSLDWINTKNEFDIQFYNNTSMESENISLNIAGTYNYFPYFFRGREDCIIGEFNYIRDLATNLVGYQSSLEYHIFIKITNQGNPNLISAKISSLLKIDQAQVRSKSLLQEKYLTSITTLLFWMEINSIAIAALIAITLTILLYTSTRIIVQSKENGLNRALGLKPIQNFQQRNLEVLIILSVGVLFGSLIGLLISQSLLLVTNFLFTPPIFLLVPWDYLGFLLMVIILVSVCFNLIILALYRRVEIPKLLRAI